jgi:predicted GIY-YIG superfamily endonuclease
MRSRWYNDKIADRYIYAIQNIEDQLIHTYIGQSIDPEQRFVVHENQWVRNQCSKGVQLKLVILEKARVSQYEAYQLEMVWLRVAIRQNHVIQNSASDQKNARNLWDTLKPLLETRALPDYDNQDYKAIEDERLINHLHVSLIRLIGET